MALAAWPEVPNLWLEDYVVWRINSGDPDFRPPEVPPTVPAYALEFLNWCIWRRKGTTATQAGCDQDHSGLGVRGVGRGELASSDPDPSPPAAWLLSWCIWRFQNSPPPKPPNIPKEVSVVAPYCWSVLNWMAWKRAQIPKPVHTEAEEHSRSRSRHGVSRMLRSVNQAVPHQATASASAAAGS